MSRISKWKIDKTKVKVVFRLQFHSTHIPQSGWDKLFVSFIPAESGKTTAKTTKANVRNGTCKWADPIYETTRLLYDSKSKQYDEKLYRIVVAMGTSRASILGDATINLADYVDALKPSDIALPLQGCSFGTILHVTVQLLTSKTGFREFEQQRELRERGLQSGLDNSGHVATGKMPYPEEFSSSDQTDKVIARIKSKTNLSELSSLEEEVSVSGEYEDSGAGYDISSNNENSSTHDIDSLKSPMSSDQQNATQGSDDNKLAMAREENDRLRGGLELAESSLFDLKLEVDSLQGMADVLAADVQKLSQQLLSETASSEELVKEVDIMKSECLKLKNEIIELKSLKLGNQNPIMESNDRIDYLVGNVRHQFLRGIAVVEDKIRELLKKTYLVANDDDTKFIYSELDALLSLLLGVKHENGVAERTDVNGIRELRPVNEEKFAHDNVLGLDLCQPQSILPQFSINSPASEEVYTMEALDAMKGQIFDLVRELDESKIEKEGLIRKMNEMECYYEALTQELEENQKNMLVELQSLRKEHSTCIYTLSANRAEIESLHHEMNQETLRFMNERQNLEALNKELERRATTSEASLRRARLNYSIAVDKLQKDLELLSSQVTSVFETNENLIKQALPLQLHMQGEPSSMASQRDIDHVHLSDNKHENLESKKRSVGGDMLLEDMKRSFFLQQELYQKVEEEFVHLYSVSFNLDIYSKALEESLREADDDIIIKNKEMDELVKELQLSAASHDQLLVRFQRSKDEIDSLNNCNSELVTQNQLLEDKIMITSQENHLLLQKLEELESSVIKLSSFEKKYDACLAENMEMSLSLKHEALENEELRNEKSTLKEKLEFLEAESSALTSVKADLEESTNFVWNKFVNMLESYNNLSSLLLDSHSFNVENRDIKDVVLLLEEIQNKAFAKISQLMNENKQLESKRVNADLSLNAARSEITMMKQKFKSDMQDVVTKLDLSAALVDKLQVELDSMAKKFHSTSEFEERYAEMAKTLMDDFALLEDQIREITSETGHLAEDTIGLDALAKEFDRTNLTVTKLIHDNQELAISLQQKTQESKNLSSEISLMSDSVKNLQAELHKEIAEKDKIEEKFRDLTREILAMKQKFKSDLRDMMANFDESNALMNKFQVGLESLASKLYSAYEVEERYVDQNKVLLADLTLFENQIQELTCENGPLPQELSALNALEEEFRRNQLTIFELMHEKQELAVCLQDKSKESIDLASEVNCLKENLRSLHDESAAYRVEMETRLGDLTYLSKKDFDITHDFEQQKAELLHARGLVSDLELEKSRLTNLLGQQEVYVEKLQKNTRCLASAESDLEEMHGHLIAADIKYIYVKNHYKCIFLVLQQQVMSTEDSLRELQKRYNDAETNLNHLRGNEAKWREEKANMSTSLQNLRSEIEAAEGQNKLLSDEASELERLKSARTEAEKEICDLNVSKEELEILIIILKDKLAQLSADLMLLVKDRDELMILRSQYNELSRKLSQQVLKTEEFKNLSTHLKELKDKAEAECLINREKRETEVSSAASQDSLRIAFLKEQYETRVQELTQKLSISTKHGEEMLMKLQDAIDETENRKKSEAMNMKKIEELSHRLAALEAELVAAVTEKREKSNAYDRTKAELECALLSLECCREEKEKLEASLLEFESEKSQTADELAMLKENLETLKSLTEFDKANINFVTDSECEVDDSTGNLVSSSSQQIEIHSISREQQVSSTTGEELLKCNGNSFNAEEEHIRAQRLRSSLEHLHEELEKMKNENSYHEDHDDPDFQISQSEIIKLQKTNEELRGMYPLFDEISSNGNAFERVLALEIELAEALKVKNKLNVQFQSSFLKQHSDDEAIFKSFRDINELIREMLELKGRHASMEAELRDMHERYSQLSLHFAEVEGERQKLKMTLKNVRASRRITALNRSSSSNLEHSPP